MGSPDEFLNTAASNIRAFNDATSMAQLFDRALTADEAYGILDATEVLVQLMPRALIRLSLAVGQSLAGSSADDAAIDGAVAPLAVAATHMAQAAHFISEAGENIDPLLAEVLDDAAAGEAHQWRGLVAVVRGWTKTRRGHQAAAQPLRCSVASRVTKRSRDSGVSARFPENAPAGSAPWLDRDQQIGVVARRLVNEPS